MRHYANLREPSDRLCFKLYTLPAKRCHDARTAAEVKVEDGGVYRVARVTSYPRHQAVLLSLHIISSTLNLPPCTE